MAKIIAIANQKGGVGKTTTAINLCAALGETQRRVLLVDLDPQGNATTGAGVDKNSVENTACDLLLGVCTASDAIVKPEEVKFHVLPSNSDLTAAEVELMSTDGRERRLTDALQEVVDDYDYIYIDCPPALNVLTLNAFVAANGVLIPMQCEYYALEGLSSLLETIRQVQGSVNPQLEIEGILRTMFDGRNKLGHEVSNQLIEHFDTRVYRTIIPRNVRLAEAPSFGQPIVYYDKSSRGSIAYLALAGEIIRRQAKKNSAEKPAQNASENPMQNKGQNKGQNKAQIKEQNSGDATAQSAVESSAAQQGAEPPKMRDVETNLRSNLAEDPTDTSTTLSR